MTNRVLVPENQLSSYLLEGMRNERYNLYWLGESNGDRIVTEAVFGEKHQDKKGYKNPLGTHLTHISAMNIVSQSIISHYCKRLNETKHELGEFIGKDLTIRMKKPISLDEPIRCVVDIRRERGIQDGLYGRWEYYLNDGAFNGLVTGIIPLSD